MNCEPVARHCQQRGRKKATNRKNPLCYRCWLDVLQWCFDKNYSFGTKVVIFSLTKKGRDPQSQEYTHELLQAVLFGNKCTHFLFHGGELIFVRMILPWTFCTKRLLLTRKTLSYQWWKSNSFSKGPGPNLKRAHHEDSNTTPQPICEL